ncbi:aminotransferase class V-fold PLP-dependent enzyme [Paracoccus methylarcula]|uniref:Aminotransferase class V-fold PLP-dependent enzyme n=1 Tax=Paracoccus methylarcula TaxID=72022 RepID=A0A3R7NC31_9RHOB|nr:aminotransferase class V-fold PLP-dependent enzyme [Paracoccus methylarcula]RNF34620.1 aminotransferase class V-fold PLP-dependent enzyme [Paracoccus methylarcula]
MNFFEKFREGLGDVRALDEGLIGRDAVISGPFGPRRLIYADYVASGRALRQVEETIIEEVLPWYANSHTEASHCGGMMTRLRRAARAEILRCTGGGDEHAVVFTGSGATAALNRLVHIFGIGPGWTVLIGPYEHHSNILPWRESGARVVEIPEAQNGGPDLSAIQAELDRGGPILGAFSAASNVTGVVTDVAAVTRLMKQNGAKILWDYAGGAPYLPIDMGLGMDAVVASPHKFIGGPGASGVMILRRDSVRATRPTHPGGGTVRFVNAAGHDYASAVEAREESGTPNVIGDIRAAMVFALKDAIGQRQIDEIHSRWLNKAACLDSVAELQMLGHPTAGRLPILAFRVRDGRGGFIHQQLATRMLSDLHGVQARGGCACAGPYVHRLLNIDEETSARLRAAILRGEEVEKPGFVRLNLCWAAPEADIDAILDAICDLARNAPQYTRHYSCDPATAIFHPVAA